MRDRLGRKIKVGDVIGYAMASGSSGATVCLLLVEEIRERKPPARYSWRRKPDEEQEVYYQFRAIDYHSSKYQREYRPRGSWYKRPETQAIALNYSHINFEVFDK